MQEVINCIQPSGWRLLTAFNLQAGGLKVHPNFKQEVIKSIQSSDNTFETSFILRGANSCLISYPKSSESVHVIHSA